MCTWSSKLEVRKAKRLNIRKSTLRGWRQQFAQNLRELGVAANATERAVRGAKRTMPDRLYRAVERGEFIRLQSDAAKSPHCNEMRRRHRPPEGSQNTRRQILEGWRHIYSGLSTKGGQPGYVGEGIHWLYQGAARRKLVAGSYARARCPGAGAVSSVAEPSRERL